MSQSSEWRSVRVGLLVTAALVVAGLAIIGISSRQNLFERKVSYFSLFPDAAGLKEGNGVWYQGVEVGFITSIDFTRDLDVQKVVVHYKIKASLMPRMRSGTRASIRTLGLLGDKYLALTTPSATEDEPIILPGSQIPIDVTVNLAALGRGAQDLMENSLELSKNLNKIAALLVEGDGALPKLLNDPVLGKQTIDNLESIGQSMDRISTTLASGKNRILRLGG